MVIASKTLSGNIAGGINRHQGAPMERDWQAEDDFRTLQRAEEVKMDKDRHARAITHGKTVAASARRVVARGQAIGIKAGEVSDLGNGYRKL